MNARNVALLAAAFSGLTSLVRKAVPEASRGLFAPETSHGADIVWQNFSEFCWELHNDLSVGDVEAEQGRVRQYVVARALDDLCGRESPAPLSEN